MLRKIISSIPNTITLCNLLSGFLACICAFSFDTTVAGSMTGMVAAWWLIALAALFDFCDGAAARLLHAYSPLGAELDSLSDLVSFGVAPALLLYNILQAMPVAPCIPFLTLLIPAMGALRLAKFNIDDSQTTEFKGLPIPANAIFWIGASALLAGCTCPEIPLWAQIFIAAVIIGVSLLMVCNMRMFSLKIKNFGLRQNFLRYLLIVATICLITICGVPGLAYAIILYVILSAVAPAINSTSTK